MITRMRAERLKRGWTQEELGKKVGLSKPSVQRIEVRNRNPSMEVIMKLEDLFGLTCRELFAEVPEIPESSEKE